MATYSASELARAADFAVRRVATGGATVREVGRARLLEIGPAATSYDVLECVRPYLELPDDLVVSGLFCRDADGLEGARAVG
jgi:hypothetical protein